MKKRIRKKVAKRAAESGETQRPIDALHDAVEELKDSVTHLFETARSELQQGAAAVLEELRGRARDWLAYFNLRGAATSKPNARSKRRPATQPSTAS